MFVVSRCFCWSAVFPRLIVSGFAAVRDCRSYGVDAGILVDGELAALVGDAALIRPLLDLDGCVLNPESQADLVRVAQHGVDAARLFGVEAHVDAHHRVARGQRPDVEVVDEADARDGSERRQQPGHVDVFGGAHQERRQRRLDQLESRVQHEAGEDQRADGVRDLPVRPDPDDGSRDDDRDGLEQVPQHVQVGSVDVDLARTDLWLARNVVVVVVVVVRLARIYGRVARGRLLRGGGVRVRVRILGRLGGGVGVRVRILGRLRRRLALVRVAVVVARVVVAIRAGRRRRALRLRPDVARLRRGQSSRLGRRLGRGRRRRTVVARRAVRVDRRVPVVVALVAVLDGHHLRLLRLLVRVAVAVAVAV
mmetsp:Transcript_20991/g.71100  ORF Transcript_20991/g.71100 Transcript_20991/m.71100 type:complete len:366 (-) Transcript_20991:615-1712(-)